MRIIAGELKSRQYKTLDEDSIRPTSDKVKEAVFSIIGEKIVDASFIDLFAGTGGIGYEASSRGAKEIYVVDNSIKAIRLMKENIKNLGLKNIQVKRKDAFKLIVNLHYTDKRFDIIFSDPPYNSNFAIKTLELLEKFPILKENGLVFFEHHVNEKLTESKFELVQQKVYKDTCLSVFSAANAYK